MLHLSPFRIFCLAYYLLNDFFAYFMLLNFMRMDAMQNHCAKNLAKELLINAMDHSTLSAAKFLHVITLILHVLATFILQCISIFYCSCNYDCFSTQCLLSFPCVILHAFIASNCMIISFLLQKVIN